jgi:hypothetical protein
MAGEIDESYSFSFQVFFSNLGSKFYFHSFFFFFFLNLLKSLLMFDLPNYQEF